VNLMSAKLSGYGKYLGTEKFNFVIKERDGKIATNPFYLVKEIKLPSGNYVSTKALSWASIYGIKCLVTSQSGTLYVKTTQKESQ
jgi:CRISPR/Cas system-associated endonuclease Cas1